MSSLTRNYLFGLMIGGGLAVVFCMTHAEEILASGLRDLVKMTGGVVALVGAILSVLDYRRTATRR